MHKSTATAFILLALSFAVIPLTLRAADPADKETTASESHTPPANSPERKAILDALRAPFERELKQPVQFEIRWFKVAHNWAFVFGAATNPKTGKAIVAPSDANANFCGLLRKNGRGEWTVVEHASGMTDPFYESWAPKHHTPSSLFQGVTSGLLEYRAREHAAH